MMKKWLLRCSNDGCAVDFETILENEKEPDFWTCENIAQDNNCNLWCLIPL